MVGGLEGAIRAREGAGSVADRGNVIAIARILWDVLAYRLRKLEMANLAGAVAIMLALHLEPRAIALRILVAFVLNVFVYLNNDYHDVRDDLHARGRDVERTRFLSEHLVEARVAHALVAVLVAALAAVVGEGLWLVALLAGGVCWLYSAWLKRVPYADVIAMIVWGGAMPMCGVPLASALGVCMAGQLALYSGVFETMQVRRDREEDAAAGVRTTAVVLGDRKTAWLTRALVVVSAIYGAAMLSPWAGAISASALLVGTSGDPARDWTRIKLVLGLAFLLACVLVHREGGSSGLLIQLKIERH